MRRAAIRDGRFARDEQVTAFRAINAGLRKQGGKNAPRLFLANPETGEEITDDADITDTMLDESMSELMESEVLRVAKLGGMASEGTNKRAIGELSKALDAGAAASPMFAKAISKLRGMMRYLRAKYGEVFNRAVGLQRAIQRGDINEGEYQAFLDKIAGRSDVTTANEQAVETAREVIDGVDRVTYDDGSVVDVPFSIDRSTPLRQAQTFDEARIAAKRFIGNPITNKDDGLVATLSKNALGKILSQSAAKKSTSEADHSRAVANLDNLFSNAIRYLSKPDDKGGQHIRAIRRYASPVMTNRGIIIAKITVKEFIQPSDGTRLYSVETLKMEKPAGQLVSMFPEENQSTPHTGFEEKLQRRIEEVNEVFTAFSISRKLSHSDQLTALQSLAAKLAADPERKRAILKRASDNLQKQRRDVQRDIRAFGKDAKTRVLSEERTRQNIVREAKMRQALRRQELEDAAYAQYSGMIDQPDLAKLTSQPIHAYLHNPASPLKGRIRSRGATAKMQGDANRALQ